jgi:NAD(P)-dependent dehydrogenase (short-subunit alcohol dehydrogenase family)
MCFASIVHSGFVDMPTAASVPDVLRSASVGETTLGRARNPEDVADAVEFLLSITGTETTVDGGTSHGGAKSISDALRAPEGALA